VARYAVLRHAETTAFAGRPASAFGDTLMELMETYWTGLSRLVEGPFSLLPPARPNSGKE
jgi:hypothetical protein